MRSEFTKYLKYFDTGIDEILEEEIDFDKSFSGIDENLISQLKNKLSNELSGKSTIGLGIHFYQTKSPIHDRFVLTETDKIYTGLAISTSFNSLGGSLLLYF